MELVIQNLTKTYPNGVKALDGLSLHIKQGMFGLLGPNGAGKSSLMRTLATLQEADAGQATLGTIDVLNEKDRVKQVLGYLPQEFGVYPRVSAQELLNHYAVLKGIVNRRERREMVKALLEQVNLYEVRRKYVSHFSGGMRQRFGIAQALLGSPSLLIVDEPTAGLDPAERMRFNNLLSELSEEKIVILSTHIVDDVSDLCHDMAIMNRGQVLLQGNPTAVLKGLEGRIWEKKVSKEEFALYDADYEVIYSQLHEGEPLIHVLDEDEPGRGFLPAQPTLEDVYFTALRA